MAGTEPEGTAVEVMTESDRGRLSDPTGTEKCLPGAAPLRREG
jgi:hypothetical protein